MQSDATRSPGPITTNKIAKVTALFWIIKICATTLGETAGDLLSMTLKVGYLASTLILVSFFLISFIAQVRAKRFHPTLYWFVILTTSTAGTTMSDFMDRTLELGYAKGSLILVSTLAAILIAWRLSEKSLSVSNISSKRVEIWYWAAILVSNTLGTALGDYLADDSGLGFAGGAALIGGCLLVLVVLSLVTRLNRVLLFWAAFVLTRPFGATFGDLMTKSHEKGGLNFGTIGSSLVLGGAVVVLVTYAHFKEKQAVAAGAIVPAP